MAPVSGKVKGAAEALKGVLEANGISEKVAQEEPESVKQIEMFLFNFSKIQSLEIFTGLTSLFICQQAIHEMECLDSLHHLESLWICETNISKIKGLDKNTKLERLFLYSNKIRKIENLGHLTLVHTLWLQDNEISEIENLEALCNLKQLSLARNKIHEIGTTLDSCTNLSELNLAGNELWSFKDLLNITRSTSLRKLAFNDPDWGDNPVCDLCNYQTYVFFHLQQLSHMDTLPIPEEGKQLAEATYMKKKMYYNMRIKTLKRNTTNILRKGRDAYLSLKEELSKTLMILIRQQKDIERETLECQFGKATMDANQAASYKAKLRLLKEAIENKQNEIQEAENMMLNMKTQVCAISDYNTSRLIVELETGGNIRLEDGKPSDVWYSSCVDLVNSRFFQQDFQAYGVSDLRVVRVTRIHNRFLRNRFEERLEQLVDTSDGSYKRSLEYLFYGQDPRLPGEILRVAEEGFRPSDFYGEIGMEAAVSLSNSLSIADIPRIQDALKKQGVSCNPDGTPKMRYGIELGNGQLLITKVFLARCTAEKNATKTNSETGQDEPAEDLDTQKPIPLNRNNYPKHDSVYRVKAADTKQRTWFVFDHYLVLPEYLVEFEYVMKHKSVPDPPLSFMTELVEKGVLHPQNETEASDMGPLARSLIKFLYQCNLKVQSNNPEEDECTKILNSPPIIPDRSSITMISLDTIMVRCGADLSNVKYLNLHSNSIKKLENLSGLVNLETLILSFNEISKMEGLDSFMSLTTLDLSFNLIRRLDNLKTLSTLTSLEVNNNLLYRAEDLSALRKYTPNLIVLNLSNNSVCDLKSYRFYVLRRLLKLETLDGRKVSEAERQEALTNTSSIKLNMIRECAFVQRRSTWSLLPQNHRVRTLSDKELLTHGPDDDTWCERVVELELNHRHLRKLSNLEKLVNLRVLSVCDNEILSLQGLERCTLLEELLMEENRISKIEFVSTLVNLKKLDLGKNKITRIEGLESLSNLVQLSLEDNEIESLSGLNSLTTLLELYVGNNKVEETKQILQLRPLPKLIIFDLSGNPVAARGDYRLYTIFHLKKLKVLDGLGVESGEQSTANETYSGRLSEEFLADRLGHSSFDHVSELDLASCKIRDTADCITGAFFPNLRILNLDNNFITDLSGVFDLSSLSVLRLNHNRIENLLPEKQRNGLDAPALSVSAFSSLEVLQLGFNDIHSLASLRLLPLSNLKVLFVQGNDISRIDGLEHLTQVRELVLDKNKIRHVEFGAFSPLKNLRELYIEENGLKSLSNFLPLPKLQVLHVGSNRISEMSDIDKLSPLPAVVDLTLANNPVARKQLYRATAIQKLPSLKLLDNKEITVEERERVDILFTIDSRNNSSYPSQVVAQASSNQSAGKVPIKLSSVTFDQLGGGVQSHLPAGQHPGGAAGTASFVCIGLGSKNADSARSDIDWHPFHNSTGDFFLPAGKISGRPRIGSSSAGSTSDGDQQRDVENWALAAERRASPHSKFAADKARAMGRPRSGDRPGSKVVGITAIPSGAAAAMASAALEARATAANMNLPGQPRGRKLGFSARARVPTQT